MKILIVDPHTGIWPHSRAMYQITQSLLQNNHEVGYFTCGMAMKKRCHVSESYNRPLINYEIKKDCAHCIGTKNQLVADLNRTNLFHLYVASELIKPINKKLETELEKQERLLKEQAIQRIKIIKQAEISEEQKAKNILAIEEQLQDDLAKLRLSGIELEKYYAQKELDIIKESEEKKKKEKEEKLKRNEKLLNEYAENARERVRKSELTELQKAELILSINKRLSEELEKLKLSDRELEQKISEKIIEESKKRDEEIRDKIKNVTKNYENMAKIFEDIIKNQSEVVKDLEKDIDSLNNSIKKIDEEFGSLPQFKEISSKVKIMINFKESYESQN
jgi:hypothetical protein